MHRLAHRLRRGREHTGRIGPGRRQDDDIGEAERRRQIVDVAGEPHTVAEPSPADQRQQLPPVGAVRIGGAHEERQAIGPRQARQGLQQEQVAAVVGAETGYQHHLAVRIQRPSLRQGQDAVAAHPLGIELLSIDPTPDRPQSSRLDPRLGRKQLGDIVRNRDHTLAAQQRVGPAACRGWIVHGGHEAGARPQRRLDTARRHARCARMEQADAVLLDRPHQPTGVAPLAEAGFRTEGHPQMRGADGGQLPLERSTGRGDQGAPASGPQVACDVEGVAGRLTRLELRQQLQHGRGSPPRPGSAGRSSGQQAAGHSALASPPWAINLGTMRRTPRQPTELRDNLVKLTQ